MSEIVIFVLVASVALVFGLIIGAGLQKHIGSSENKIKELQKALDQSEEKSRKYQNDVTQHFAKTANMVNDFTMQYKELHDHLSQSANDLCTTDDGLSLLPQSNSPQLALEIREVTPRQSNESDNSEVSDISPPLDYAPKTGTGNSGTLAEDYGLEKVNLHADVVEAANFEVTGGNATASSITDEDNLDDTDKTVEPPNVKVTV